MQFNILTVLFSVALVSGIALAHRAGAPLHQVLATHAAAGLMALLFGRAIFVAQNWVFFAAQPAQSVALAAIPGIAGQGALIGWLLAVVGFRKMRPVSTPALWAGLPLLIGAAVALGCIPNGCLFGRELAWTDRFWFLRVDWPDTYLIRNPRWPAQLILACWFGFMMIVLFMSRTRTDRDRYLATAATIAGILLIRPVQGENGGDLSSFRFDVWLDVAILCASLALAFFAAGGRDGEQKNAAHARASVSNRNAQAGTAGNTDP